MGILGNVFLRFWSSLVGGLMASRFCHRNEVPLPCLCDNPESCPWGTKEASSSPIPAIRSDIDTTRLSGDLCAPRHTSDAEPKTGVAEWLALHFISVQWSDIKCRGFSSQASCAGFLFFFPPPHHKMLFFSKKNALVAPTGAWYLALGPELEGNG